MLALDANVDKCLNVDMLILAFILTVCVALVFEEGVNVGSFILAFVLLSIILMFSNA